jgi:hypothetical protein
MKSSEKRTKTEPGLGKATGEGRSPTSTRARMAFDADRASGPITPPPISAPPPIIDPPASSPPMSAGAPRHTRPVETPASFATTESNERLVIESRDQATSASNNDRLMIERRDTDLAVQSRPAPAPAPRPIARGDSAPPNSQPAERIERVERESNPPTEHRTERIDLFLDHGARAPERGRPVTIRSEGRDQGSSSSSAFKSGETGTGTRAALDARVGSRTVDGKPIGGARGDGVASEAPAGRAPTNRVASRASARPSSRPPVGNNRPAPPRSASSAAPPSGRAAPAPSARPAPTSGRPAPTSGRPAPTSGRPAPTSTRPTSTRPTLREEPPAATADSGAPRRGGIARSARPSIREDNVGAAANHAPDAVGLAGRAIPRLLKTKSEIAAAPIDHRAGFLLSYIDGTTSVQGLVDIAAMPEDDVHEILERLRRLGIVSIR